VHKKYFRLTLILFLIDRLTKELISRTFEYAQSIPVLKDVLHLTYITNTGIAFGMGQGKNIVFIILSLVIIGILVFFFLKTKNMVELASLSLILAGALGNMFDRVFYGEVIDFIDLRIWPVFNLADSFVTIGGVVLFYQEFIKRKKAKQSQGD